MDKSNKRSALPHYTSRRRRSRSRNRNNNNYKGSANYNRSARAPSEVAPRPYVRPRQKGEWMQSYIHSIRGPHNKYHTNSVLKAFSKKPHKGYAFKTRKLRR